MAECGTKVNSGCDTDDVDNQGKESPQGPKRGRSHSPSSAPPQKSPRIHSPKSSTLLSEATEKPTEPSTGEVQEQNPEGGVQGDGTSLSPNSRRKSWRRSTRGRRSLPALFNPSQTLCCAIDPSLPEEDKLEKLLEASMRLALQKTKDSLQTLPNACLESFQSQMESIQKEWGCLAKDMSSKQPPTNTARDPAIQKAMEQTQKAIHRLQVENESWESLLNKHRSKADELARRVEQGQQGGVPLDPACLSQSSQSQIILGKPDYQSVLCRQQPLLHTIELVMDSQCKMVRELLSIQGQGKLLVKETSSQVASEAGFQHLPSDPLRNLLAGPGPTLLS
ncbi:kinetochore-associated protein DSN1 homolog [Hypomesus transpacificus]|uniref:kinetochore-associated protein DSN1 homolog n=1 Tax=Hypomesus transpacificus TaxID=137520 RepID=UPI001F083BB1|nr:kinetochore-associated protein DSN1 homolog [Hypomesus transpacificus]